MELRRSTVAVGLVALVLLDVALIVWALWPSTPAGATRSTASVTPSSAPPSTEGAATAQPTPTAPGASPAPLARLVSGVDATTAWLVDGGECGRPGSLHVTLDAGAQWQTQPALGSVTRIRPSDASSAFVVGGDADCAARVWYTGDRGESWSAAQSAADAWGRSPDDPRLILRPGGAPVQPCRAGVVLDLVGQSTGAAVALCADGAVRATSDSGATWSTTTAREGLLAISQPAAGDGAAAGLSEDCPGLTVFALEGGRVGASVCVERVSYAPGQVAISVTDGAVWLVAGDDVFRADAVGSAFTRVSGWPGA